MSRPRRVEMLPRWQMVVERRPISISALGRLRLLMHSMKFSRVRPPPSPEGFTPWALVSIRRRHCAIHAPAEVIHHECGVHAVETDALPNAIDGVVPGEAAQLPNQHELAEVVRDHLHIGDFLGVFQPVDSAVIETWVGRQFSIPCIDWIPHIATSSM